MDQSQDIQGQGISWEISAEEKRTRTKKTVLLLAIPFIILGAIAATVGYPIRLGVTLFSGDFLSPIYDAINNIFVCAATIGLVLVVNKIYPYKNRKYQLTHEGITISKGKRQKQYMWSAFEFYYSYSDRVASNGYDEVDPKNPYTYGASERKEMIDVEAQTMGKIYYLRKKSRGFLGSFLKVFVVVYSEPDNDKKVSRTLSKFLQKKQMKNSSDLGMVFYEFK